MIFLLYTIHVLVCLFLILVVLLQQGKGADLSVFGGGATQAAFGARGAVSLLHKLTVWGFVAFIVTTVSIGFMTSSKKSSSVLSNVPAAAEETVEEAAPPAEEATGEAQEALTATEEGVEEAEEGLVPPLDEDASDDGSSSESGDGEGADAADGEE